MLVYLFNKNDDEDDGYNDEDDDYDEVGDEMEKKIKMMLGMMMIKKIMLRIW